MHSVYFSFLLHACRTWLTCGHSDLYIKIQNQTVKTNKFFEELHNNNLLWGIDQDQSEGIKQVPELWVFPVFSHSGKYLELSGLLLELSGKTRRGKVPAFSKSFTGPLHGKVNSFFCSYYELMIESTFMIENDLWFSKRKGNNKFYCNSAWTREATWKD